MAGSKRERELHRAKLARQQKEAAEAAERRKRRLLIGSAVGGALIVIGAIAGVAIASGDDSDQTPSGASTPSPRTTESGPAPGTDKLATPAVSPPSQADTDSVKCVKPNDKKPATKQYTAVNNQLRPDGKYTEAVTTNCGKLEFTLDSANAPKTVAAFTFLSDRGFFDNTTCHRIDTSIKIIQCGDPLANGTGGPGFKLAEENLPEAGEANYPRGTVAMANSGPNSTGSQFFIVYEDTQLPPDYTILGTVTAGMPVVDHVASKGSTAANGNGPLVQPFQISKMISTVTYAAQP